MKIPETYQATMTTCGGRVVCPRCTARSKRSGLQCGRPALKNSRTQKCNLHGGRSTGPKTPEGKARCAAAHTKTGEFSNAAREAHARASARLLQIEDTIHLLGMTTDPRKSSGRKPRFYEPVKDLAAAAKMMVDDVLYLAGGSATG